MQETLEVRLKESTYQVVSDWPYNIKMEHILEQSESFLESKESSILSHSTDQTIQPSYSTTSQVSRTFHYIHIHTYIVFIATYVFRMVQT